MKKKLTVYTPNSDIRNIGRLFNEILNDIKVGRELAFSLLWRNITARYRQSFMGIIWAFLPTIVSTIIWVFLQQSKIFSIDETTIPYPVYVMVGTILWGVFTQSINAPINIVKASKAMIIKINFPREALLMTAFGEIIFDFLIKIIMLFLLLLWFGIFPGWSCLLFFVGVLLIIMTGMTLGIGFTPLAILTGDIQSIITTITGLWFFLTPIVYPVPKEGLAALIANYNPISPILITTRDWLTVGFVDIPVSFWVVCGVMLILFIFSLILYKVAMPHIIERIGS